MTIRTITGIAVECEHRDGPTSCQSALNLRVADPVDISADVVRIAAAERGWSVADGEFCPKHRHATTQAAPTAETGA